MFNPSAFPIGASLSSADLDRQLPEVLRRLHGDEPVTWLPVLDAWYVVRRDLTIEVMRDAKRYTVDHPGFSTAQVIGPSMLSLDGQRHLKHRQPFEAPFRKTAVTSRFRPPVAEAIDDLILGFDRSKVVELRRAYAGPVAVEAMVTALGLDATPVQAVLGWYDAIVDAVTRVTAGEPVSEAGKAGFEALKKNLLPALQSDPSSSLLAAASGAAEGLTDDEIVSNAAVLLFGGIETTEGMIANALYHLLSHPEWLSRLRAEPEWMSAVIEESLRLEPAASVVDRYTTEPVELNGVAIPEGALVRVSLSGANRDPAVFHDPDRFDPTRPNLKSHVTFAQGPHVCLGLHLARLETALALEKLIKAFPEMRFAEESGGEPPAGLIFRKPDKVNVRLA